jgi:hypothetical protein
VALSAHPTSGAAGQPLAGYRRREPEHTVLHELVARHAQTMLAEVRAAEPEGGGLPRHVERELAEYLRCGILAHGFARVRCQACQDERLCRYGARPAFAHDRLAWTADGRISYQLKRPWPDGRTHLVLEPVAFLRRLVCIIAIFAGGDLGHDADGVRARLASPISADPDESRRPSSSPRPDALVLDPRRRFRLSIRVLTRFGTRTS